MTQNLKEKSILLIISGGIAAYKSLELIRLLKKAGCTVRCILTKGGEQFVTPLSVSALCEQEALTGDTYKMDHIHLSRTADAIVIAPASANIIAQIAHGLAQDLATTALLAADKPALIAPAMNHKMWHNPATQANIATLQSRGHTIIGPEEGDMACGERGLGRMSQPEDILKAVLSNIPTFQHSNILKGRTALVTSGPTLEPLDPVRFIGNRSSGKQGHAIATALAAHGADVTLVTGPVALPDPPGIKTIHIETAQEMLNACENALNTKEAIDIAVCAAAVSDWSPTKLQNHKIKKRAGKTPPSIALKENPDILKTLSTHKNRPMLIIGFAAETENLAKNAADKLKRKKCNWILANLVGQPAQKTFGEDQNHVYLITSSKTQDWKPMSKDAIATRLVKEIANYFETKAVQDAAE
ncbi:MAG: bifunctional phosphopantothenoylcysteine decarboxylase/phosphopantothenate--cysteine ligase CoaBC [Rhodospirillales bacterium]|nr:MAG: bifunctional phosphopantothenoylcysteine decarboxylase/phosphopantothenate--cysteine ligase CoaBC [Rhodospirillales bacterium]